MLARPHGNDRWALVGGGVEPGEEPAATVAREIREELGVEASIGKIIGVYGGEGLVITYPNGDRCAYVTTAYECRLLAHEMSLEEDELSDVAWFAPADLAALDTQPAVRRILLDAEAMR